MSEKSPKSHEEDPDSPSAKPIILAIIFTFVLIIVPFQIIIFLQRLLLPIFEEVHPVVEPERINNIIEATRPIGYICLFIVIVFIIIGLLIEKKVISVSSSFLLFLPSFSGFASSMFFLAGIGIIQVIWLPLYTHYFNFLRLGDILFLPAIFIPFLFSGFMILNGLPFLTYGIISWINGKYHKKEFINTGAYKYSRHPQYIGFLLYSYGIMGIYKAPVAMTYGQITLGASLPWVIFALILLGLAFMEDIELSKKFPNKYKNYRKTTPFFIKLPKPVTSVIKLSFKIIINKKFPETRRDVIKIIVFYGIIIIFLSLLIYPLFSW